MNAIAVKRHGDSTSGAIARGVAPAVYVAPMSTFGSRMRAARMRLGMRQRDLAAKLDIDVMQISRWETGPRTPQDANQLAQLAEILEVTIDHLVRGTAPTSNARWTADEIRSWPVTSLL